MFPRQTALTRPVVRAATAWSRFHVARRDRGDVASPAMSHALRRATALAAGALSVAVLSTVPASAASPARFERIAGLKVSGTPAKYDKVGILKVGSPKARNVLVLNPGTSASAAYFQPLADAVVAKAPKWQVWSVERRENLLEDQSMLNQAKA